MDGIIDAVGNVTLYAKWEEIIPEQESFTVSFDTDGGSDVPPVTVLDGETFDKPDDPTKNGFTFEGWYKEAELTNIWVFETDTVTANITLYAKWEEA